jgi:hypothetical protein
LDSKGKLLKMEISSSAVTGALRVGLQVVSNHKRPMLEFHWQVRNRFGPEQEYQIPEGVNSTETRTLKTRHQDIFIQFILVNIGSIRAENVELKLSGNLKRNPPRESFGEIFEIEIPQIAPGQLIYLFQMDSFDILQYPEGGGKPQGIKKDTLTITATYNAPRSLLNWLLSLRKRNCGKKQYETIFTFNPKMVCTDLPPAEYAS